MEPSKKSNVPEMFGPWLHITAEAPYKSAFRPVEVLVFASTGFTCGIAITNLMHTVLGEHRALLVTTGFIIAAAAFQVAYFTMELRRMRTLHEEIKASAIRVGEMTQDHPPEAADGSRRVQ